jgi:CheY-like chemotaxis protein
MTEEDQQQTAKLETLGRLAGGVAHDFNNLLTVIEGYARMLREEAKFEESAQEYLEEIIRAADRASSLTRQLLAFSRNEPSEPRPLDLNESVRQMQGMLRRVIGEDVELLTALSAEPALILADPGQIEQVVMNLVVNARDAMPHGGRVRLEVAAAGGPEHDTVELRVSDTGTGIPDDVRTRMFEPFFTTKEPGKGTGLGLAVVRSIVEQAGGQISVETSVGVGTLFRIRFPRESGSAATRDAQVEKAPPRGRERLLLVEDEASLRSLMSRILEQSGYRVTLAADGAEAIRLIHEAGAELDLLVADVRLPSRSGQEVAEEFRICCPQGRVLFMSGYGEDTPPGVPRLEKPFSPRKLAQIVRDILDGR